MSRAQEDCIQAVLRRCSKDDPVLIAGPTASGKSALALALAERQGGTIINADALQVFSDWRVLTARPSEEDENRAPHALYGHVAGSQAYSVGNWLRDVQPLLGQNRAIIIGGTGLYFSALTEGLAEIPDVPTEIRVKSETLMKTAGLQALIDELDTETAKGLDLKNPRRVQRAWEVLHTTGRGLSHWQAATPPPLLPLSQTKAFVLDAPKEWLTPRIEKRFGLMIQQGALEEAKANQADWHADLPSAKAIGAAELMAYLDGSMSLAQAQSRAEILTRQYAKRQRSWFKARMQSWTWLSAMPSD